MNPVAAKIHYSLSFRESDQDWLLGSVLKVLDVVVKINTSPGKLAVVEQTRKGATFVCLFVQL